MRQRHQAGQSKRQPVKNQDIAFERVRGLMAMRFAKRHNLKAILLDRKLVKAFGSREAIEAALRDYLAQKAKRRKSA